MGGDYRSALEAAGAVVHNFESFGSYQGDWWAKVTYKGDTGFVRGSYGSCSGCDAFEAEFGYAGDKCEEHEYEYTDREGGFDCDACRAKAADYQKRLAEFGENYLDGILNYADALSRATENIDWDSDAQKMADWIVAHQ